jgi:hypothetical protein
MLSLVHPSIARCLPMMGQTLRGADGGAWVVCGLHASPYEGGLDKIDLLLEPDLHAGHGDRMFSLSAPAFYAFCDREHIVTRLLR